MQQLSEVNIKTIEGRNGSETIGNKAGRGHIMGVQQCKLTYIYVHLLN